MNSRCRLPAALLACCLCLIATGCGGSAISNVKKTPVSGADSTSKAAVEKRNAEIPVAEQNAALARLAAGSKPIFCGGTAKPWVALTFDDGPGPYTKKMLKILDSAGLPATFFLVGRNVGPWRSALQAERSYGAAIGNHSWSHPLLTGLANGEQRGQLLDTKRAIEAAGAPRVQLFRPPYGAHDAGVDRIARRAGMVQILWNVDSEDALGASYKKIARLVKRGMTPGAIILMHENRGQTIRAMKYTLLPHIKRQNRLKFVTVPQMLAGNPPTARQLALGRRGCR